ncbi:WhiB family transcriptional regulator [Streptomyces sp.]|uniref:WhiB family transcriptional regulator n=1 Tax=Streptomyces sp. TaxID=1931 RepID=UPI002F9403CB
MTTDWMRRGACRKEDPELWFPLGDGDGFTDQIDKARALCRSCPVVLRCLSFGLTQEYGIWGGTTEKERRGLRRQLPKHTPAALPPGDKECANCGEEKSFGEFNQLSRNPDGHHTICRVCVHEHRREHEYARPA